MGKTDRIRIGVALAGVERHDKIINEMIRTLQRLSRRIDRLEDAAAISQSVSEDVTVDWEAVKVGGTDG